MSSSQRSSATSPRRSGPYALARKVVYWPRLPRVLLLAALFFFVIVPLLTDDQLTLRRLYLIGVFTIIAMGLNISLGRAGEFFLGIAGLFAFAAYTSGVLTTNEDVGWDPLVAAPVTIALTSLLGIAMGLVGLRVTSWYFAIITFYFSIVVPLLAIEWRGLTNGEIGISGVPPFEVFGHVLTRRDTYWLVLAFIVGIYLATRNLFRSPWGLAFATMRHSQVGMQSLGVGVVQAKLLAYVFASIPCAIAGVIFVHTEKFITPGLFSGDLSFLMAAGVMFGGAGTLLGPIVGNGILQYIPQFFDAFKRYELLIYGAFLIVGMLLIPRGVVFQVQLWATTLRLRLFPPESGGTGSESERNQPGEQRTPPSRVISGASEAPTADLEARLGGGRTARGGLALRAQGVTKRFGGVAALQDFDFEALPGQITALIGANGSGKTTFLNLALGYYRMDSGNITVGDRSVRGLPAHKVVRHGVARTFQTPNVVPELTVRENVLAGMFLQRKTLLIEYVFGLPRAHASARRMDERAKTLLELVGLAQLGARPAGMLSTAQRRLLEIARALGSDPAILLLDEPASGLSRIEVEGLGTTLRTLRSMDMAIVLVEHNVPFVLSVADTVTVLDRGRRIAVGTPGEVQRDPQVIASYLGEQLSEKAAGGA